MDKRGKRLDHFRTRPGLAILGYGVIEVLPGKKMRAVDYGCVFTEAHTPLPDRLMKISDGIAMLFETYRPDAVSMEELFFAKNVKTGIMVAQARGVALEGCARRTKELYEYTPLQVKQAVVGYGRAEKQQVQFMVKTLLQLVKFQSRTMRRMRWPLRFAMPIPAGCRRILR